MPINTTKLKNASIAAKSAALRNIPTGTASQVRERADDSRGGQRVIDVVHEGAGRARAAVLELCHHLSYSNGALKPGAVSKQRNDTSVQTAVVK